VQVQQTLENKQVTVEDKPWKGFCCKRCYFAKSDKKKCKCRCLGKNHAASNLNFNQNKKKGESD
jgi:hypothetical protein